MVALSARPHVAGTPLQEWAMAHEPDMNMIWRSGYWTQVMFVRDRLARLFFGQGEGEVRVVGSHRSKSIRLPVYSLLSPEGLEVRLRYNFYNWVVSVSSPTDVSDNFGDLFERARRQEAVYSEGFDPAWVFPPYALNQQQFSLSLGDDYEVYTFCTLLIWSSSG